MLLEWSEISGGVTGVIHAGAYQAEERKTYKDLPVKWIEADPDLYADLKSRGLDVYHFAALDYDGKVFLNICPFRPANSVLEPNLNRRRPDVNVIDTVEVPAGRIERIQEPGYNLLVMDIQGAELMALHGVNYAQIDYLVLEVHRVETYVNCPMVEEIDAFLDGKGYTRKMTKWVERYGWGEAYYTKK